MAAPTVLSSGISTSSGVTSDTTGSQATQTGDLLIIGAGACCFFSPQTTVTQTGATWTYQDSTCLASASVAVFEMTSGTGSGACTVDNDADNFNTLGWVFVRPGSGDSFNAKVGENSASGDFTATITSASPSCLIGYAYTPNSSITWTVDSGWTESVDESVTGASHNLQYRTSDDAEWIADESGSAAQLGFVLELLSSTTSISSTLTTSSFTPLPEDFVLYVAQTSELTTSTFSEFVNSTLSPSPISAFMGFSSQTESTASASLVRNMESFSGLGLDIKNAAGSPSGVPFISDLLNVLRQGLNYVRLGKTYVTSTVRNIIRRYDR